VTTHGSLEPRLRPLTPGERRLLATRARKLTSGASVTWQAVLPGAVIIAVLWALTLLASDAPWTVVTGFWIAVGGGILLWVWLDARRDARYRVAMARSLESALAHDQAEVYDITARAFVELEEYEDEGACYAFDLGGERIVFVTGQEFYPKARFPSLDFSLVYPLDENGATSDFWIEKRGAWVAPDRVIPAAVKWELEIPEHLTVVRGALERLEEILATHDRA
jgi:hypothetical protein